MLYRILLGVVTLVFLTRLGLAETTYSKDADRDRLKFTMALADPSAEVRVGRTRLRPPARMVASGFAYTGYAGTRRRGQGGADGFFGGQVTAGTAARIRPAGGGPTAESDAGRPPGTCAA